MLNDGGGGVSTLWQRRCTATDIADLVALAPAGDRLDATHRDALGARLRSIPTMESRRLDAWMVEHGGHAGRGFVWSPTTARRIIGTLAYSRQHAAWSAHAAVRDEIADQLATFARGYTRLGSLGHWLSGLDAVALSLVESEAVNWALQLLDVAELLGGSATLETTDGYYHVAGAQTTVRARRDFTVNGPEGRVVLRIRSGRPGKSAGPGLRADLVADALATPDGQAARRFIGLWPEAGLALAVDGTMENLRSGARDLVRAAVVQRRERLTKAA